MPVNRGGNRCKKQRPSQQLDNPPTHPNQARSSSRIHEELQRNRPAQRAQSAQIRLSRDELQQDQASFD